MRPSGRAQATANVRRRVAEAPSQTLKRTPLYDRHVAASARMVPFAGWEMPVQYEGIREEHVAVRTAAGVFDVSHMGEIESPGPQAAALLQRLISNDVAPCPSAARSTAVLCREDGGVLDDLFTYRLAPDRYLTVTNAVEPREGPRLVRRARRRASTPRSPTRSTDYAMLAVQGPQAREIVQALADGAAAGAHAPPRSGRVAGAPALVCGTGYTGEDGVELLLRARTTPPRCGTSSSRRGAAPAGLGARDTLRLEACLHLYGNDLIGGARPDRGRPRLVLQGGHGLHRRRRGPRRRARPAPPRRSRRSRSPGRGIPRPGQPDRGRRRGHERHAVAVPRRRDRHGLPAGRPRRRRAPRSRSTSAARPREAVVAEQAPLPQGD